MGNGTGKQNSQGSDGDAAGNQKSTRRADTTKEQENLENSLKAKVSGRVKQGDWADHYSRKRDLGSGMSGVVFLVQSKNDPDSTYACKSIEKTRLREDEVDALRAEINLCASLDHPNIVKIVESYESPQDITMIMELCKGGELYDSLISEGEYTQARAATLFKMMVQAVNYCHSVGVVHRDLKLENFVFEDKPTIDSVLKLIDFGLSVKHSGSGIQKMTSVVGTAYYMAPEVLGRGQAYDAKCDVWALGVILFMMLTGAPPFNGKSEKEIMLKAEEGKVNWAPWSGHGKEFDAAKDLIKHMLVPSEKRYDCSQVLQHTWLAETMKNVGTIKRSVVGALADFSKKHKLYRTGAQIIAVRLSPSEIHELRAQFQVIDSDSSGTISLEEFKKAINKSSDKIQDNEFDGIFNSIDLDGTGLISYSEFLSATLSTTDKLTRKRLNEAFDELDPDGSNTIETSELKELLSQFADDVEIENILASVDKNQDKVISREEFLAVCIDNSQTIKVQKSLDEHLRQQSTSAEKEAGGEKEAPLEKVEEST